MKLETSRWIEMLHLESKVDKFIKDHITNMFNVEHEFKFYGTKSQCLSRRPHVPHVMKTDVKKGVDLQTFCLGKESQELVIVVEKLLESENGKPELASGYYYIREVL